MRGNEASTTSDHDISRDVVTGLRRRSGLPLTAIARHLDGSGTARGEATAATRGKMPRPPAGCPVRQVAAHRDTLTVA